MGETNLGGELPISYLLTSLCILHGHSVLPPAQYHSHYLPHLPKQSVQYFAPIRFLKHAVHPPLPPGCAFKNQRCKLDGWDRHVGHIARHNALQRGYRLPICFLTSDFTNQKQEPKNSDCETSWLVYLQRGYRPPSCRLNLWNL